MGTAGERREPITVILLSLVTCGIYMLFWLYKVTEEIQAFLGEQDMSPVVELILCMFVPFYSLYWVYKYSQKITRMQGNVGLPAKDDSILHVVLTLVFSPIMIFMFQDNLNKIWAAAGNRQAM